MKVNADTIELLTQTQKTDTKKTDDSTQVGFRKTMQVGIDYGVNRSSADVGLYDMSETTSLSDVQTMAENADMKTIKNAMGMLSNQVSSSDVKDMLEDGFSYGDMEVDSIVTETDKIKINLAAHDKDFVAYGDKIDAQEAEEVTGSTALSYQVANKFKEEDLPTTDENVNEAVSALAVAQGMTGLSDGAMKYMVSNQLSPTIENVYKASYSSDATATGGSYGIGYFTEGSGYYGKTSSDFNWDDLQGQMSKVIQNAGLTVDGDSMTDAKWLVQNNIPLTTSTLTSYQDLQSLQFPVDTDQVLSNITDAVQDGKSSFDALLTSSTNVYERAQNAYSVIQNATDDQVKTLVESNQSLTIANLSALQKQIVLTGRSGNNTQDESNSNQPDTIETLASVTTNTATTDTATASTSTNAATANASGSETGSSTSTRAAAATDANAALLTARRQMEEIRLQMTAEANVHLLKQGISIETESLSNLVDALKQNEQTMLQNTFKQAQVEPTEENVSLYTETMNKVDSLKTMPSYVLGTVATGQTASTVNAIYDEGSTLKTQLDKASASYETLMTQPRKDMGDSITKAFQNVDDILEDMGLETTEANERAVRILGYNNMAITDENIQTVKEADQSVNTLIQNLTPSVALTLIRNGKNPLNTNIDTLNEEISDIQETQDATSSETKYSKFLYNLEKNNDISEDERATYIGMYRLLNNVEKSDGSVIGALVNQNADITLNNLLSAVRTSKSKGMDVSIDDEFGGLDDLTFQSARISDQLAASFGQSSSTQIETAQTTTATSQAIYYQSVAQKALNQLTPAKLQELLQSGTGMDTTLEQFAETLSSMQNNAQGDQAYYEQQQQLFKQASTTEDSVISILQKYDQPLTVNNLLAASGMFSQKGGLFKGIESLSADTTDETKENLYTKASNVTESLNSKEEAQSATNELLSAESTVLDEASEAPTATSDTLLSIQLMRKEIQLSSNLATKERYQVPVEINGEMTAINLTINHDDEQAGNVTVTMENDTLGKVAAQFTVTGQTVTGYIAADSSDTVSALQGIGETLQEQLKNSGLTLQSMQVIKSKGLDLPAFEDKNSKALSEEQDTETPEEADTDTAACYKAAKALIASIKITKNS